VPSLCDEVVIHALNKEMKSEEIKEAGKRKAGSVRVLQQAAISLP